MSLVAIGREGREAFLASAGYSRQARYALAWSAERVSLYDTLMWRSKPADTPLFEAETSDRAAVGDLLQLIGRDEVLDEVPSDLVAPLEAYRTRAALPRVLGNALQVLRLQVAEASAYRGEDPAGWDTDVLRLFHQLLYVRIAEDRGAARSRLLIRSILEHEDVGAQLADLLADYARSANSELFEPVSISVDRLPSGALQNVLKQTVEPWERLRLDFTVARADLAGKLYESYLASLPAKETEERQAGRLFAVARGIDEREKQSTFYTPPALARLLAERALGSQLRRMRSSGDVRVVDPACGSGAFLVAAYESIRDRLESRHGRYLRPAEREGILVESLFGADVDERALGLAQVQLLEVANLHGKLPSLRHNLFCGDSLPAPPGTPARAGQVPWDEIVEERGRFTTVLGNPPFGAQAKLPARVAIADIAALRDEYPEIRAFGHDYAYFFLALAVRLLGASGTAGMVMPRGLLALANGQPARRFLSDIGVSGIVDFRAAHVFPRVAASVATIAIDRKRPEQVQIEAVRDSREDCRAVLDDLLEQSNGDVVTTRISSRRLADASTTGWTPFRLKWLLELQCHLGRETQPLGGDGREVRTGIKSAGVSKFVLGPGDWQAFNSTIRVDQRSLPARYLPRVVYASDIEPFNLKVSGRRLFLPFESSGAPSSDPDVLAELALRGGLPKHYQRGHLPTLCSPKILVRAFAREPAAVADVKGDYVPVMRGVHAIRFPDLSADGLEGIAALLNSSFYQWFLRGLGAPRSDETVEMSVADIERLPLPVLRLNEVATLTSFAFRVKAALETADPVQRARLVRDERTALDAYVIELLDVSSEMSEAIAAELIRVA